MATLSSPRPSADVDMDKEAHVRHIQDAADMNNFDDLPSYPNANTVNNFDIVEAKRIRRKVDFRLLPLLILLYTLAFLDRVNIGNARLWHLERDLDMTGYDYNIAVLVFYIPYILFGIPANMLPTRLRPRYWIGGLTICFGAAGFCTNRAGFLTTRVLLGAFEAGMFPACMYLINTWYCRHELSTHIAWFMVANNIAGATSGLLGAGLGSIDGVGGYSSWSWIFFVEGGASVLAGILAVLFILDFPNDSDFLPPEEKAWLLRRLEADDGRKGTAKMSFGDVATALVDWKVFISGVLYVSACVTAYSVAVFAPTILAAFGWDSIKANLLSSPIRITAGIASVSIGIFSDRLRRRGVFVVGGFTLSILGNILVMLLQKGNLRYMGLYFTAVGVMAVQPLIIGWCVNQVASSSKRGTVAAFAGSMGQIGGIISALAFPKKDAPQYVPGMSINVGFLALGIVAALWLWFWARRHFQHIIASYPNANTVGYIYLTPNGPEDSRKAL
ncbi:hypothetical protein CDV31_002653 [Fusarium ambrosium]|uniref:Major facilitator superfamily (MFS) profile domain-containing protein n=1 Tax=Fusarium ambrosium TaxID=131363 RepID=A0A428UW91_9HYPO|nr:hypothetical protein CDV31_002653 [Fusarium ambrosium]